MATQAEKITELEEKFEHMLDALKKHWSEIEKLKLCTKDTDDNLIKHRLTPDAHNPAMIGRKVQ